MAAVAVMAPINVGDSSGAGNKAAQSNPNTTSNSNANSNSNTSPSHICAYTSRVPTHYLLCSPSA